MATANNNIHNNDQNAADQLFHIIIIYKEQNTKENYVKQPTVQNTNQVKHALKLLKSQDI